MSNASSKTPAVAPAQDNPVVTADAKQAKWGPTAAIIISVLAYLAGSILAGIVVYAVAALMHKDLKESNDWLASIPGQFLFVVLLEGLIITTIVLFLKHRGASIRDLGFRRRPELGDAGRAVIAFVLYFGALIIASALAKGLLNVDVDQKQELGFDNVVGGTEKIITFISLVVLPPIAEEILFRGFLFTGMRKRLKFVPATIFVSLIFASLHLFASNQGLLWIAGIDTFILSLVLCYLREKTGNLWASIAVHMIKNTMAFIFLYVVTTG
jgi:membrane protease YdiL (CAAX protease family)